MKTIIISTLVALSIAAPQYGYAPPSTTTTPPPPTLPPATTPSHLYGVPDAGQRGAGAQTEAPPPVAILRDERDHKEDGTFTYEFEGDNGIIVSESGSPTGPEGAVVHTGNYKYTAPDGTEVEVTYVADENGFQPQSDLLPVAPEFPHPIPQFVLDQIAFAAEEDAAAAAAAAAAETKSSTSDLYQAPQA
ncbi:cuticle protein AM1274-like [Palaemon carinicauda]|uniref:cuticle protein AM1274-like n=1 Tax=Palaemon carinicauda TaxID=392227 RepID=UPI0035B578F7